MQQVFWVIVGNRTKYFFGWFVQQVFWVIVGNRTKYFFGWFVQQVFWVIVGNRTKYFERKKYLKIRGQFLHSKSKTGGIPPGKFL